VRNAVAATAPTSVSLAPARGRPEETRDRDWCAHRAGLMRLGAAALAVGEGSHLTRLKAVASDSRPPASATGHIGIDATDGTSSRPETSAQDASEPRSFNAPPLPTVGLVGGQRRGLRPSATQAALATPAVAGEGGARSPRGLDALDAHAMPKTPAAGSRPPHPELRPTDVNPPGSRTAAREGEGTAHASPSTHPTPLPVGEGNRNSTHEE
jgi:hypothetical protein